jgi:glycerol-3-phosphate dehydrogenase
MQSWQRPATLGSLGVSFDLLVIGGGVVGCGIALDAVTRGLSVALVERDDFAAGTSSRSTKLLHGGVRYLPQLRFGLVREGLREQKVLDHTADYLVKPFDFVIPVYRNRGFADAPRWARHPLIFPIALRLGLWLYDRLGGRHHRMKRRLDVAEVKRRFPRLRTEGLRHALAYRDYQTDDARLTMALAKTAAEHGAVVFNWVEANRIAPVAAGYSTTIHDRLGGGTCDVRSRAVVAATGAFAPPPGAGKEPLPLILSKGAHLVADIDGVGLDPEDADYLLRHLRDYLDADNLQPISSWSGLRSLVGTPGGSTAKASREHKIARLGSGLIQVAGGKLTGYRRIAQQVVDRVVRHLGSRTESSTDRVLLSGSGVSEYLEDHVLATAGNLGIPAACATRLIGRYGTHTEKMLEVAGERPELLEPIGNGRWILAEAAYAARHESAATITDFVQRRTRLAWFTPDHARSDLEAIGEAMAAELGWDEVHLAREQERVEADLRAEGL